MEVKKENRPSPVYQIRELSKYFGVHRNTMSRLAQEYDLRNVYGSIDLIIWLHGKYPEVFDKRQKDATMVECAQNN
jgi:hypothetical protein